MGLQEKSNRNEKLCEKKVMLNLLELNASRKFKKAYMLFNIEKNDVGSYDEEGFINSEKALYKEEVLYDFRALAPNKNSKVALC